MAADTETKNCKTCHNSFVIRPDDFSFYQKMNVPAPNLCPECRYQRRAAWRNEFNLYNRKCDLCGVAVVSMFSQHSRYTIYCPDCYHSDKWDPASFAKEYDRQRPFFDQLGDLIAAVPKSSIYRSDVLHSVNSPYENFAGGNKDCYLIANSGPGDENCAYARGMIRCRDTFDAYYIDDSDRVYEGVSVHKSSGVLWSQNTTESLDSAYLMNCVGLQNCFGCVNLRHKKFHFLNESLSKETYQKRVGEILGSYRATEAFRQEFEKFSLSFPRRATNNLKSTDVDGDYVFDSKNCHSCFEISYCENVSYGSSLKLTKDSYDIIGHGRNAELLLETVAVGFSTRVISSWWGENNQNVEYCVATRKSEQCFGCDGVKNVKYAILNKTYIEEEYKELRAHIVNELTQMGEYGLFFPPVLALFAYNEGVGCGNFPLTKEEVLARDFRWADEMQLTKGKETMKPEQIPDHIKDVPDSILNEVLACITCGRNYRLIKPEFEFYQRMSIPVPRKCFFCRHADRIHRRGPFKIYDHQCAKCQKDMRTTYAPDRPEIVYCEECYQHEVI